MNSREATILDASRKPIASPTGLAVGHNLLLKTHMPPSLDDTIKTSNMVEDVKKVDPQAFHLVWGSKTRGMFFGAEQWLILTEQGDYTTFEMMATFSGVVPHLLKLFMGGHCG